MGQAIGESPSSKVLFMDPDSIPAALQSLLAMSDRNLPEKTTEAIAKKPFGESTNISPTLRNLPEIKPFNAPRDSEKGDPSTN
jgi:hypothetical protein